MRRKRLFNDNWQFVKKPIGSLFDDVMYCKNDWQMVDIPHDWLIYDTNNLYETGEGWYKKEFTFNYDGNKIVSLYFDGIYMDSTICVNGINVAEWKYGYSSFEVNITDVIKDGNNQIIVRVVYQRPNSRWYSGAGIYRNVWLIEKDRQHFATDGIYISSSPCKNDKWQVDINAETVNENAKSNDAQIQHIIIDDKGKTIGSALNNINMESNLYTDLQTINVDNPMLWEIDNPYLYYLVSELIVDGEVIDRVKQRFGFRSIQFKPDAGFFLNGKHVKTCGTCEHHDLGALGSAVNKTAIRRQLSILKEMGVNGIRTGHSIPAVEMMDLADEMGILIASDAFDVWEMNKTKYDYARFFPEWHERDIASWIRRDRNHPSVIMWSVGNEVYDTHAGDGERGKDLTTKLRDLVYTHDAKRNARVTFGSNYLPWENTQKSANIIKLAGYNYGEYMYKEHHEKYPDWIIYGSETAATVQSRGIYHFPASQSLLSNEDEQCSSLGNCTTSWGAKSTAKCITDDRDAEFSAGQFIWTGFDYIGEPTPYFTKNSYFGQVDTAGFRKDSYYQYQAEWTDYKTNPMIHLLPYWDFNEGQLIDIRVYSNAPKVELFFNEDSKGVQYIDHEKGLKLAGEWQLSYHMGTLRAVAYDENDNIIAVDEQKSFGDAVSLKLESDKRELSANSDDLIFVTISAYDDNGIHVANANNRVEVTVSGAGRLVGLDNGNSTDYDQYKGTSKRLFGGKLLAIIASTDAEGDIIIMAESVGLISTTLELTAVHCDATDGSSRAYTQNTKSSFNGEIPIRKIELINDGTYSLNKENRTASVTAKIYPENATYSELEWKATNNAGIDSSIVKITPNGNKVDLTAAADGDFRLRCFANNGTSHAEIISEIEFTINSLGKSYINPYEFVSGGLYNASNVELGNGNQRGVATMRKGISYIGFHEVDFGDFGSDEVTLPIFHYNDEPLLFEIWEGMPDEDGSEKLLDAVYNAKTKWNTYQENTFKLPRRLKGITTLCFVFDLKIHFKGFKFKTFDKAYEALSATECNRITGDYYKIDEDAITEIGNNVTLYFDDMDFGSDGATKIAICGYSHNKDNTIHIRFKSESENINQIVEFDGCQEYSKQIFELDRIKGLQSVMFVFMPGSKFDFKWFKFIK